MAEGTDTRVVEAAVRTQAAGTAIPVLIGPQIEVAEKLRKAGAVGGSIQIADPSTSELTRRYAEAYYTLRKHKGLSEQQALERIKHPLNFSAMMVRAGDADGCIGGAVETTAATVRAALQIIGVAPDVNTVSSFFLLFPTKDSVVTTDTLMFSDCALVISPDREQLADIACSASDSYQALIGETPKTAMLSFSTAGSGSHESVTLVRQATELARSHRPELLIDGEIQFDAAFVQSVAARKAPDSVLKGAANVFIFPSLDAANIGYKIAQRIGGMKAIGPILQGLAKPANDLSRGCSAEDVFSLLAVTSVQAAVQKAL